MVIVSEINMKNDGITPQHRHHSDMILWLKGQMRQRVRRSPAWTASGGLKLCALFCGVLALNPCMPPAQAQHMYDSSGRQLGRIDGERIYDSNGRMLGRMEGLHVYDASGRLLGRLDGDRVYDSSGRQLGRVDGERLYSASGRQMGRMDGERIYDASGRQIGRADGLRRMQMVVYFFFFM
jgi:sporulation protein YlmC with PRC-barrel domain